MGELYRFWVLLLFVVVVLLFVGFVVDDSWLSSGEEYGSDESSSFTGFAVHPVYRNFSSPENGFLYNSNNNFVTVSDDIVYRTGYYSVNGGAWRSFSLFGSLYGSSNVWLRDSASYSLPSFGEGEHYVIVYSCSYNNGWNCHDNRWQLLIINNTASSGGENQNTASCDDGIKNGDETGIDCGGSCENCGAQQYLRTFYVSSSNGNDSNTGTSPSSAWRTIDKVNSYTLLPGDAVLFRKGDTFVGTLNTRGIDGTLANPITFSSYGSGNNPVFSGLITLENNWVNQGGNIWRYDVSSLPTSHIRYLVSNGINQKMAQSRARYSDSATQNTFTDADLGGADGDYAGAEVLLRTTSYTLEIRDVTGYRASTGTVTFSPGTYYPLGSISGSAGGYILQNSLRVLQQNAAQNSWAHDGNYVYYYSSTNPYNLEGDIQVSSIDTLVNIEDSEYIIIDGINLMYANNFAIFGGGSDYKKIINCRFERCGSGIMELDKPSSNSIIDNNVFLDIGSVAIHQHSPTSLTVTNNDMTNIGVELGRTPYLGNFGSNSVAYSGIVAYNVNGGLFEYNNIRNIGYIGVHLSMPSNHVLVQHNYVENPCILLVDGGAFYSYSETQTTTSNIDRITYRENIAAVTDYINRDYMIANEGGYGWLVHGFYKDGFLGATNWENNFAYGFDLQFFSNPTKYSTWINNVGVDTYTKEDRYNAPVFYFSDMSDISQVTTNTRIINNTIINAFSPNSILDIYESQLSASTGNVFDYNRILRPNNDWRDSIVSTYPTFEYYDLSEWKAKDAVGEHESTDLFLFSKSGLSDVRDFVWIATNPSKENINVNFPPGYRYYDIDGNEIKSDTLGPYRGEVYYRTINQGMPQAKNIVISGTAQTGYVQTASYDYSHEQGNSQSGSTFQWYRSYDGTKEARAPISGANSLTYQTTSSDRGQYVLFGVVPRSAAGSGSLLAGVERFSQPRYIN